jgi:hypothetical protein
LARELATGFTVTGLAGALPVISGLDSLGGKLACFSVELGTGGGGGAVKEGALGIGGGGVAAEEGATVLLGPHFFPCAE